MQFYSTNNKENKTSFKNAVLSGLADDGGLYMPEYIPQIDEELIKNIENYSLQELAFRITKLFIEEEINEKDLRKIINESINFTAPLANLNEQLHILELFHGPTLAFKDFGARFMASTFSYFLKNENKKLNILVATSGDTGSAVAGGFFNKENINVKLLYPSGMVSDIQEKQLTTWDGNISSLEIDGTFDDCQKLVKQAFVDDELRNSINMSSANSISIARLLPQIFYYFEAYKQVKDKSKDVVVCVPSGNLGNLTAGLFAKKMGLPIKKFISATNVNNVFTKYLDTGKFEIKSATPTLSNAMDVGNPSNLARIDDTFNFQLDSIKEEIYSVSFDDEETISGIKEVYNNYNYIIDPHGAVGYQAIKKYFNEIDNSNSIGIILETAHPAKFIDTVEKSINKKVDIPERLAQFIEKEKSTIKLSNKFEDFKSYLLSNS